MTPWHEGIDVAGEVAVGQLSEQVAQISPKENFRERECQGKTFPQSARPCANANPAPTQNSQSGMFTTVTPLMESRANSTRWA